jgi:putative oxidoreductase
MTTVDAGLLVLRIGVGIVFAVHGAQKVFGWWNGPGVAGWHAAMERMGFRPPLFFAWLSALGELVGGALLALGLLSPLAATILIAQSVVIIGAAHWQHGFFNKDSGYEFPFVLAAGATAVLLTGPGGWSIDAALGLGLAPEASIALLFVGLLVGLGLLWVRPMIASRRNASTAHRGAPSR